jgi:hypothetical protein
MHHFFHFVNYLLSFCDPRPYPLSVRRELPPPGEGNREENTRNFKDFPSCGLCH